MSWITLYSWGNVRWTKQGYFCPWATYSLVISCGPPTVYLSLKSVLYYYKYFFLQFIIILITVVAKLNFQHQLLQTSHHPSEIILKFLRIHCLAALFKCVETVMHFPWIL